eukprot:293811-Chlamydomonas_euryale.AAC.12
MVLQPLELSEVAILPPATKNNLPRRRTWHMTSRNACSHSFDFCLRHCNITVYHNGTAVTRPFVSTCPTSISQAIRTDLHHEAGLPTPHCPPPINDHVNAN